MRTITCAPLVALMVDWRKRHPIGRRGAIV
jgi:hypothetical protein